MKTGALNPNQIKYPTWQLVEEKNLTEAATSVTFSGLAGNTDEMYMLNVRTINGIAGESGIAIRFNNDSGTNYGFQCVRGIDSGVYAGRNTQNSITLTGMETGSSIGCSSSLIYAKSGYVRTVLVDVTTTISGTTISMHGKYTDVWNNTADEITSIVVFSYAENGLGVGTYIALYKKVYS